MPWEGDRFTPATAQPEVVECDELAEDRERRHEARRFFKAAPPYCIEFDADGTAMLCQKVYEYWPNQEPEEATTWRVISRHQNVEDLESSAAFRDIKPELIAKGSPADPVKVIEATAKLVETAKRRQPDGVQNS